MRTLRVFLVGILITAVVVGLGVVVARNPQNAQLDVLGNSLQTGVGWLVAVAAGLGFVLAFLLLIPGRLASAWRSWSLSRQGQDLEAKLQALREEHQHLQGRHQHLLEEHNQMLRQVMTPAPAGGTPRPADGTPAGMHAQPLKPTGPIFPNNYQQRPAASKASSSPPSLVGRLQHRISAMKAAFQARLAQMRADRARSREEKDQRNSTPRTPAPSA